MTRDELEEYHASIVGDILDIFIEEGLTTAETLGVIDMVKTGVMMISSGEGETRQ